MGRTADFNIQVGAGCKLQVAVHRQGARSVPATWFQGALVHQRRRARPYGNGAATRQGSGVGETAGLAEGGPASHGDRARLGQGPVNAQRATVGVDGATVVETTAACQGGHTTAALGNRGAQLIVENE